jgi:serine/threonine-protein kinase RsbW
VFSRSFQRALSSVPAIFLFLDEVLADRPPNPETMGDIRLAVDEVVTNMVTHQPYGGERIEIALERRDGAIIIRLIDSGVDRFDLTAAPEPELDAAPEQRREGGLGIYLVRQLMSAIRYEYDERLRRSTVTMEKILEA